MVGSNIQRFAGDPRPLGKKRRQEQCQGFDGRNIRGRPGGTSIEQRTVFFAFFKLIIIFLID